MTTRRAIDLGPVEAAAIKTAGGKIRLRLLLTADQLEAMLIAARANDPPDMQRNETQRNAREEQNRFDDDEDDASAPGRVRDSAVPPTAPVGRGGPVFVYEGTRAWDAWVAAGHNSGLAVRRKIGDRVRTGWDFPSLFPPKGEDPETIANSN